MYKKLLHNGSSGGKKLISKKILLNKKTLSWALYDWGNSAFATTVIAGFFPIFFKSYWAHDVSPQDSTFYLGLSNSISSFSLALLAPFLGYLADQGRCKKQFLSGFAALGILCTACLFFLSQGQMFLACTLFALASLGFSGGNIFYDGLIVDISDKKWFHIVSGYGYALGYLGGGLLFAVNVAMTLKPELFGLADKVEAVQVSFLTVAVWWLAFTVPLILNIHEERGQRQHLPLLQGLREFISTLRTMIHNRPLILFFVAYLFYIDGVNTTIKMAVDYGMSLGFESTHLITALLIVQFIGFPAAIGFGFLGQKVGARPGIFLAIGVYVLVIIGGYFMQEPIHFYLMAIAIGCVQGGIQSLSRSFYAEMIPSEKSGEFFGIFNMVGKFSAILGPMAVGLVSHATGSSRLSILVLLIFFGIGALLLYKVTEGETKTT